MYGSISFGQWDLAIWGEEAGGVLPVLPHSASFCQLEADIVKNHIGPCG